MDVKLSIQGEDVGMDNSIMEFKKDEGGASMELWEEKMDSLKEERIWSYRRERMNALLATRTAEGQDPAETCAAAQRLVLDVIKGAEVEDFILVIEWLVHLINPSAILDFRGPSRDSLLHVAVIAFKVDILRLLLFYANYDLIAAQNDWGDTSLHSAAKTGNSKAVKMLICRARENDKYKDLILRKKNKHGNTALHEAVLNCHVDVVRLLLGEDLEPVYWKNGAEKSPLYLALDAKDSAIHEVLFSLPLQPSRIEGLPPIHGVIVRNDYALPKKILKKDIKLFAMTDSGGGNVFHLAAFLNWPLVRYLLLPETEYLARERDMNGDLPIHIAAKMGHVELIEKLHPVSQLPNGQGQTVLHVAAKYGQASAVRHILRHPELGKQINAVDHARNTPLHLAVMHSQPATLIPLLLDKRIQLDVPNNKCLTALDIAQECISKEYSIRKQLALTVLVCSCTGKVSSVSGDLLIRRPEARDKEFAVLIRSPKKMPDRDIVKDSLNSRMVVATLVATVTFAAGLAVPGGFNGSDTASKNDWGMATMMDKKMFQAFAICNTIAMFCSMITVVNLIWARLYDVHVAIAAFEQSELPLTIALLTMFAAFLTGVTLTVGKLPWLANTIFYLGLLFVLISSGAKLLEKPPSFMIRCLPIRRLTFWLILACIYMWRVKMYLFIDDAEDVGTTSGTSAGQPADGARESKTDDSTTAKCGDAPRPPSH